MREVTFNMGKSATMLQVLDDMEPSFRNLK